MVNIRKYVFWGFGMIALIVALITLALSVNASSSKTSESLPSGTYWVHYQENPGKWETIRTEVVFEAGTVSFKLPFVNDRGTVICVYNGVTLDGTNYVITPKWERRATAEPTAYAILSGSGSTTKLEIETSSTYGGTEPITLTRYRPPQ